MTQSLDGVYDVIVAGGGPVGMGLAIELGQRDLSVLVIERHPEPQPVPKGQNLTQRTMEHFRAWGAETELRAARTIPVDYGIGGVTAYGTLTGDYHYDWLQRDLVRAFYYVDNERLPQYATERVLRARAAQLPTIDIRYGWTVEDFAPDEAGVTVEAAGPDGERLAARGRYLVGCDGSRSIVRDKAGIRQTLSDHDKLMVLLVFRSRQLSSLVARYPGKSYYNVLHPSQKGYWLFLGRVDLEDRWFFHAPVPLSAREGDFDFKAFLEAAAGAELDIDFDHIGFWDLRFAIADQYREGRVFVAGDAAHSHPPYGGYGINTGFEDARNLGWKLAAVLRGWGGEALLDSYHTERHGVFASTARDFIEKSIEADRRFLKDYSPDRDRAAFEAEWRRRGTGAKTEVETFEPHYEGSPIVPGSAGRGGSAVGKHSVAARPGHHLTPRVMSDGTNVYERLGPGFTLLAFGDDASSLAEFEQAARARGISLTVVRDGSPILRDAYGADLVLVRPDQFVAWSGGADGLDVALVLGAAAGFG
jgi:2-polyprenyl-6-methoxyphenol hydroxylase-like FAD-dependent oxidoreductase